MLKKYIPVETAYICNLGSEDRQGGGDTKTDSSEAEGDTEMTHTHTQKKWGSREYRGSLKAACVIYKDTSQTWLGCYIICGT